MPKWVVLLGVEIFEGVVNTEDVVLVKNKEHAEKVMRGYLDKHPDKYIVGFKITKDELWNHIKELQFKLDDCRTQLEILKDELRLREEAVRDAD